MSPIDVSVVVCAYTEDRWDDILAAVASVRAQRAAAREILLVVDHNPVLLERLAVHYAAVPVTCGCWQTPGPAGCRRAATPASPPPRGEWSPSWTTTRWPSPTGCGTSPPPTPTRW